MSAKYQKAISIRGQSSINSFMSDFKLHKGIFVIVKALFLVTANAIILFSASIMWVNIE